MASYPLLVALHQKQGFYIQRVLKSPPAFLNKAFVVLPPLAVSVWFLCESCGIYPPAKMNVSVGKGTISKGVVIIFQPSFFRGFKKGSFQGGFFYFGSEIYVKKDWIFQDFLVDLTFFLTPQKHNNLAMFTIPTPSGCWAMFLFCLLENTRK